MNTNGNHNNSRKIIYDEEHNCYQVLKRNPETGKWFNYGARKSPKAIVDSINSGMQYFGDSSVIESLKSYLYRKFVVEKRADTRVERTKSIDKLIERIISEEEQDRIAILDAADEKLSTSQLLTQGPRTQSMPAPLGWTERYDGSD